MISLMWLLMFFFQLGQPYSVGNLSSGVINGTIYPSFCGGANKPAWCGSGTTADTWIVAACNQIPSTGQGVVSLSGLTGVIANAVPCSTTTKLVNLIVDASTALHVTATSGARIFPIDNGSSVTGPGSGQCQTVNQGFSLDSTANIESIFAPAHDDGSQENLAISGLCIWGANGATVSKGLIYAKHVFANTFIGNNMISICNFAGINLVDVANAYLPANWVNCTSGVNTVNGRPLWIHSDSSFGTGCVTNQIQVIGGQYEHSIGGGFPEITVEGNGAGAQACGVYMNGPGVERVNAGTKSSVGIQITDCWNCNLENVTVTGTSGGTDAVNIAQTVSNGTRNVVIGTVNNAFGIYTNTLTDTTPGGRSFTVAQLTGYISQPQAVQATLFTSSTLPACSSDYKGQDMKVSDSTSPTYMGAYTGGGGITSDVLCSYNGSTYGWVTH